MKAGGIGLGAGYLASGWYARRMANEDVGGSKAAFEVAGMEIDGTKIGAGMAIAGLLGVTGDATGDTVLHDVGLSLIVTQHAVEEYKTRLTEPPET